MVAARAGRPLPQHDAWFEHVNLSPGFYEERFDTDASYAPVLAAMGAARIKAAFAKFPTIAAAARSGFG